MAILENITLGIDLGIASVGWGLIDEQAGAILDAGVWTFSAPEDNGGSGKSKKSHNQKRQGFRSDRKRIRHKRQKMRKVSACLSRHGVWQFTGGADVSECIHYFVAEQPSDQRDSVNPWALRDAAITRMLASRELAIALYHLANHRGFQSNKKEQRINSNSKETEFVESMNSLRQSIDASGLTYGQYLNRRLHLNENEAASTRKRNSSLLEWENPYRFTPVRDQLRAEARAIFKAQRRLGSSLASLELEEEFLARAFEQGELQDAIDLLGNCAFEESEKRCCVQAPSNERRRYLEKLSNLRIIDEVGSERPLNADEKTKVYSEFGNDQTMTYARMRNICGIDNNCRFKAVRQEDEAADFVSRRHGCAPGTIMLRRILGEEFESFDLATLDLILNGIAFRQRKSGIDFVSGINIPSGTKFRLAKAIDDGEFDAVTKAAHISSLACRKLLTSLEQGMNYADACQAAGYDHSNPNGSPIHKLCAKVAAQPLEYSPQRIRRALSELINAKTAPLIGSPVARKAVTEAIKQFVAIVSNHPQLAGKLPGKVHVELARSVGKSAIEREDIEKAQNDREKAKEKARARFREYFNGTDPSDLEFLKFELAEQQRWKCVYSGNEINPKLLCDGTTYQIDHILPRARFCDDSFVNLVLCEARCNQAKGNMTPVEWINSKKWRPEHLTIDWLRANVFDTPAYRKKGGKKTTGKGSKDSNRSIKDLNRKGKNILLENASEVEENWRARNLNDTKWATKVFLQALEVFYVGENPKGRLWARPGALVSKVRHSWGLSGVKKDKNGKRAADDRHHALDAIIVAAINERSLQQLTKIDQIADENRSYRLFSSYPPPWSGFRDEVLACLYRPDFIVARAEDRKVSGELHEATLSSFNENTGQVFVRLEPAVLLASVAKNADKIGLRQALCARFDRPERSKAIIDELMRWSDEGCPAANPPKGPTGDKIVKIRVLGTGQLAKPAVLIRGGTAKNGEMPRVDVFSKVNAKGKGAGKKQFFLVPIYPHQVANNDVPPNRAVTRGQDIADWHIVDSQFVFEFSLYQKSWVEMIRTDGTISEGYFRGLDISVAGVRVSPHSSLQTMNKFGAMNLHAFCKYSVDRLGTKHKIDAEVRTWRGAAYIFPNQPD